jgi:hypothetical protein
MMVLCCCECKFEKTSVINSEARTKYGKKLLPFRTDLEEV